MITAREFGNHAKQNEINAPTLDKQFLQWLATTDDDMRIDFLIEWWDGWYEELNTSSSLQRRKYDIQ